MARRFQFRLAVVLRVRRMELQTRQKAVAERQRRILEMTQQGLRVDRQILSQIAEARVTLQSGSLSLQQVLWDRHQLGRLRRELMEMLAAREQEQVKLIEDQRALAESLKRVRVLEKYEERRRTAHDDEQRRLEHVAEDEMNSLRFGFERSVAMSRKGTR